VSEGHHDREGEPRDQAPAADESRADGPRRAPAEHAARHAVEQLSGLLGGDPERVIGIEPRDGSWLVRLEVVELERIPDTTSVLASYDVDVDAEGSLRSYRRTRRYTRAQTEGGAA
jgi:hypothetical protein